MSIPKRICLVGLPRCGSQYISNLIGRNCGHKNLAEPFTINHKPSLDRLSELCSDFVVTNEFTNLDEQAEQVYAVIKSFPLEQSLVVKLFLIDPDMKIYKRIIETLRTLGFTFVIIKREDIVDQYLSYLIGTTLDSWNNISNQYENNKVAIPVTELTYHDWLLFKLVYFDEAITMLQLNESPVIRYEYALNDLKEKLGITVNRPSEFYKMSQLSNRERIDNIKEIQEHIDFLLLGKTTNRSYR